MASISEILLAQGRHAAESRRARAGQWQPLVQHLSQLPGQIMDDREAERAGQEAAFDREQQRAARDVTIRKGERDDVEAEATETQKQMMGVILGTPGIIGEDRLFDVRKAMTTAQAKGFTDILDDIPAYGQDWNDGVKKGLLTDAQIDSANRANQPQPTKLEAFDPTRDLRDPVTGELKVAGVPDVKPDTRALNLQLKDALGKGVAGRDEANAIRRAIREAAEAGRAPVTENVPAGAEGVTPPLDPGSQDLMSQAGLTYNGFLALTGKMSQLPRDKDTRNRASAEVQAWARERGMDVATLGSQYKAYNEALENNIQRYNRTLLAEGEIAADVTNLLAHVKETGLGDVRAINAAKQWLKGELNDPNSAQYAFFLNQLVNDIALYNAASQGRATLQSDVEDAKGVVQRGISAGSLTGMQKAITQSVEKMGTVLEGAVNRSRKNVWDLFGVGDKYKPKSGGGAKATDQPRPTGGNDADPLGLGL